MTDLQKHYNEIAQESYEGDRWSKNKIREAQFSMMQYVVRNHVILEDTECFSHCLEIGPGPGTWTNELMRVCPNASFTLVDISEEMLEEAKQQLEGHDVNFVHSSAEDFSIEKKFDFFFSSRAIEYIENKESTLKSLLEKLDHGGHGAIITKMPHYRRAKLTGRNIPDIHQGQIAPKPLKQILAEAGCSNIRMRPATIHVPLVDTAWLNHLLFQIVKDMPLNPIVNFFVESYIIKFSKS